MKVAEEREGLVVPILEPVAYPHGWGRAMVARLEGEVRDDVGRLTLTWESIDDVWACGGLWQGKDVIMLIPASAFRVRRELVTRMTKGWVESAMVWDQAKPMDFVLQFLGTEANFDPLTVAMLHLASDFEQVELEGEPALTCRGPGVAKSNAAFALIGMALVRARVLKRADSTARLLRRGLVVLDNERRIWRLV